MVQISGEGIHELSNPLTSRVIVKCITSLSSVFVYLT